MCGSTVASTFRVASRMASKAEMFQLIVFALVFSMLTMQGACVNDVIVHNCTFEKQHFKQWCMSYVRKSPPHIRPEYAGVCCNTIRWIDMTTCICEKITPEEEETINVHRVVWFALYCGNAVLPGKKCGSKWLCLIS